jgi:M6 family metalloprotease-like protein
MLILIIITLSPRIIPQEDLFICGTNPDSLNSDVGELRSTTWTLKILLVEFQDVKHKTPGYTYTDFNNLFFSNGIYVSPNKYSPDGEQVFGSMRDYLYKMSDGEFILTGSVVNLDENRDRVPDWLTLPLRKGQYDSTCFACWGSFLSACTTAANSAGIDISTNSTTKLAIIYAGHTYRGGGLNPQAAGNKYINGELFACCSPYREEREDAKFSEIGINVHEFLHLLNIPDLYDNGVWDVMNGGPYLGPNFRGACPAPLNPQARYLKGWISLDLKTSDQTFQADYYLQDPEVFQIRNSTNSGNYWLIETRNFNATMTIGSTTTNDYNYYLLRNYFSNPPNQGVLVWRVLSANDWGKIIHADGKSWPSHPKISAGDPFPGTGGVKVLSPWSDIRTPSSGNYWYPNTKPSTNVGMEIVGEGTNYFTIDFYAVSPLNSSPSKPQNLEVTVYNTGYNSHPKLTWTGAEESDVQSANPGYLIERKLNSGSYSQIATVSGTTTLYIDYDVSYAGSGPGIAYYRIRAKDTQNKISVYSDEKSIHYGDAWKIGTEQEEVITEYNLKQNYPNPFNPVTNIAYQLPKSGLVQLKVYDLLGSEVAILVNEVKAEGAYEVSFDASNLPSGVYIYSLRVNDFVQNNKMTLLK